MPTNFIPTYEGFLTAHLGNSYLYDELTFRKVIQQNIIYKTLSHFSPNISVIANMESGRFLFVDGSDKVVGLEAEKIVNSFDMLQSFNRFHPNDAKIFSTQVYLDIVNFLKSVNDDETPKYRMTVCLRYLHFQGYYFHLIQHIICLSKNKGGWPLNCIIIGSDISHFKTDNNLILIITRLDKEGDRNIFKKEYKHTMLNEIFTKRELQIMELLKKGYLGKHIADQLCISENTLKNHKKNMMDKVNVSNTLQLLNYCDSLQ